MEALLLLGGNIGEPMRTFIEAEGLIAARAGAILARSRDHWTEPWGFTDDRIFLNRAVIVYTALAAEELMRTLLGIETALGRARDGTQGYAARSIDIDILLLEDQVISTPALQVPHPRIHERLFALEPAADIAPLWLHPLIKRSVLQLVHDLRHPGRARDEGIS